MRYSVLPETFGQAAPTLADAGRAPLPSWTKAPELEPGRPLTWGHWQHRPMTPAELANVIRQAGSAPLTGMVLLLGDLIIDVDADDPREADALHAAATEVLGPTPQVRYGRGERRQLFYTCDPDDRISGLTSWSAMQILRHGKQTIVGGIHPNTGLPYTWTDPDQVPWKQAAPVVAPGAVDAFLSVARAITPPPLGTGKGRTGRTAHFRELAAYMPVQQAMAQALSLVIEGDRHDTLVALVGAAIARGLDDDAILKAAQVGTSGWTWIASEVDRETDRALADFRSKATIFVPNINAAPPRGPILSRIGRINRKSRHG